MAERPRRPTAPQTLNQKLARMEREIKIDPALKAWMDNVLVPALVREYRAAKCAVGDNERDRISGPISGTSIPEQVQ